MPTTSQTRATSNSAIGEAGAEHITQGVIWAYSVPRIGFGIMGTLFGVYLMKFATDVLFIAPVIMGFLIAASRFWDGVSDPLIGYLSDRTKSPVGRRRVWMYWSAIPMGLGLIAIWSPPGMLNATWLVIWMGIALLLYETANTAFFVPYGALGVELTPNYHERTRLYGYSHMIGIFGIVLGLTSLQLLTMAEDKRAFAFVLSITAAVVVTSLVLISTRILPERRDYQGRGTGRPLKSFADVFRNKHARLLLLVYGIETFGGATLGILAAYAAEYVIYMGDKLVLILIVNQIPQFLFAPLWIRLSKTYGKRNLWIFATLLSAVSFGSMYFIPGPGLYIYFSVFFAGIGMGAGAVLSPAIQADIIDYDEYLTNERKEGSYIAVWNLIRKCAASVTAFMVGSALQFSGFVPNVDQTETTKLAIRALMAFMPAVFYIIGALLLFKFTFNETEHANIRQILKERARTGRPAQFLDKDMQHSGNDPITRRTTT